MDWDMNQELLAEEESQCTECTDGIEDNYESENDNGNSDISNNGDCSYDVDDDYERYYEGMDADCSAASVTNEKKKETGRTSEATIIVQNKNEVDRNGFEIRGPLVLWDDDDDHNIDSDDHCYGYSFPLSSDSASECNAHGVVHVRLLRARNLPCPVGSNVGATVSLSPFKGKVRSTRDEAFPGTSLDHGVCVKWGPERRQPKIFTNNNTDRDSFSGDEYLDCNFEYDDDDENDNLLSMVNACNGPNSPVPSIKIDLTFNPLGLGIFDFTMASIELSSIVLLQRPRVWRTRWCPMKMTSSSPSHYNHNDDPFIRIQALFEPSASSSSSLIETAAHAVGTSVPLGTISASSSMTTMTAIKTKDQQLITDRPPPPPPPPSGRTLLIETDTKDVNNDFNTDKASFWDAQELTLMNRDATSLNDDASTVISKRTTASQRTAAATALCKPHLLRSESYWTPSRCAVCSKLLVGIFKNGRGFRCEVCHIDCCSDCRLHVDLRVPCGSDLASDIVETSFRNKMSPSGLLSHIAPDEAYEQKRQSVLEQEGYDHPVGRKNPTSSIITSKQSLAMTGYTKGALSPMSNKGRKGIKSNTIEGIGRCRFEIVTACLFQQITSTWTDNCSEIEMPPLRKGDYYVRVSMPGSDRSARTPTLQKTGGMPHFRSAEMRFPVSHYGVAFRIDVVEADTDAIIGSALLTTQGILQEQRDAYIAEHGVSLLQFLKGPIAWIGTRNMKLRLQSGIKVGASVDEFYAINTSSKGSSARRKRGFSGWIDVCVGVEEFYSRLYGSNPIECPNRPPADLNISVFPSYIRRIKAIINNLNHAVSLYQHMVSWENPGWTATTLGVFLCFCLLFNAEYSGSLPILFFVLFLGYCAFQRNQGKIKDHFIQKEVKTMQKVEGHSIGYKIYRPRGTITVTVSKGRGLLSQDFGIAGKTSCKVIWDPLRFADENTKQRIVQSEKSADTSFDMGNTPTMSTSDPDWNGLEESAITKRLNQLIPSTGNDFFESSSMIETSIEVEGLSFPVLQPTSGSNLETDCDKLEAWESSQGAIVFQVKFRDFFNNIPGFDHVMGEVVLPFRELARETELKGWFQILDVGTTANARLADHEGDGEDMSCSTNLNPPRIYVHLKWNPPAKATVDGPNDAEQEMSHAIQEELVRSSIILKENKVTLVDSSIGSVSKAFGIGGTIQVVQNTLASIIDRIEAVINILNFTDPYKSSMVFVGSFLVWVLFCIIPTRYLILFAGLAQYGITFVDKYVKKLLGIKSKKKSAESAIEIDQNGGLELDDKERKASPFGIKITNAVRSIPTNEDLRKTYFWESRQLGTEKAKKYAVEKRESRLKKLWKAKWHSSMKILVQDSERDQSQQPMFHWESGFAVVQGHRFIWWTSADEFDDGELPNGKVILSGHAGLGGPSPIEMKKLDMEKELPLCLTVFGKGFAGQERITMLLPEKTVKQNLENAVLHSTSFKRD